MGRGMKRLGWVWVVAAMCATPAAAAQIVEGVAGDGARYALAVPDAWNGDLIVYGHGIVDPAAPVALPGQQDGFSRLRDAWLQRGFAVASSSYSENGFALKDAAQRLHQLSGLFTARFGRPSAVYLVGHSLGAAAIESLAERFPDQYDAALPMCGLLGGTLLVQAALTALGFNLRFTNDLLERTYGQPFYDNTTTVYPGAANDGAGRFTATPAALNFLGHYFTPTGELRVPTLTLHTMRDPAIPVFHERLFADAVTRAGAGDRLVQRTVQRFGHCAFSDAEVLSSFDALVSWVRTGIRPAGGDATDNPGVRP
jgi:pimeloyl-ACP methyl ester carboxylesterase